MAATRPLFRFRERISPRLYAQRHSFGFGLNAEQEITKNIGVFSRVGWNDGHNEAWLYTDTDHSGSLGVSVKGDAWRRSGDAAGLAAVMSGISKVNQQYLMAGGTGILDGDGNLNYGREFAIGDVLRSHLPPADSL